MRSGLMTLLARGLILAEEVRFQTAYPKPEHVTRNPERGLLTLLARGLILVEEARPETEFTRNWIYPKYGYPKPETRWRIRGRFRNSR